jgi:hypothetical protein
MAKYFLQADEGILLKGNRITHGNQTWYTDEIMLTNLNLIWTKIGVYGFPKKLHVFPLSQIKILNERAEVRLGESSYNGSPRLEISFMDGKEETFGFSLSAEEAKKEIIKWIKAINKAVTGNDLEFESEQELINTDTSFIGVLGNMGNQIKETFVGASRPKNKNDTGQTERVVGKCKFCSAPLSGLKGQVIHCSYCDSDQQI